MPFQAQTHYSVEYKHQNYLFGFKSGAHFSRESITAFPITITYPCGQRLKKRHAKKRNDKHSTRVWESTCSVSKQSSSVQPGGVTELWPYAQAGAVEPGGKGRKSTCSKHMGQTAGTVGKKRKWKKRSYHGKEDRLQNWLQGKNSLPTESSISPVTSEAHPGQNPPMTPLTPQ